MSLPRGGTQARSAPAGQLPGRTGQDHGLLRAESGGASHAARCSCLAKTAAVFEGTGGVEQATQFPARPGGRLAMKQWLWRALAGLGVSLLLVLGRVEAGSGADDHLGVACWGWSVDVRGGPALASPAAAPAKNRGPRQARAAAPESLGVDCVLLTERGVGPPWLDSRGPPGSAGDPGRPQLPARPVAQGRGEVWIRTHAAGFPAPKRGVLQQPLASRRAFVSPSGVRTIPGACYSKARECIPVNAPAAYSYS